jgi:hypothetical protein
MLIDHRLALLIIRPRYLFPSAPLPIVMSRNLNAAYIIECNRIESTTVQCKQMPIYPLLRSQGFEPKLIDTMVSAFEDLLLDLKLADGAPLTTIIAKKVIQAAQTGERDPQRIRERILQSMHHRAMTGGKRRRGTHANLPLIEGNYALLCRAADRQT